MLGQRVDTGLGRVQQILSEEIFDPFEARLERIVRLEQTAFTAQRKNLDDHAREIDFPDCAVFLVIKGNLPRKSNNRELMLVGREPTRGEIATLEDLKKSEKSSLRWIPAKSKCAREYCDVFPYQVPASARVAISTPVRMIAKIWYRNPASDLSDELLADCLERAGVIVNDNLIRRKYLYWAVDVDDPRVEVLIETI